MPVMPMGGYGNGMMGDGIWWLLILFLFAFTGNGWGNGGGVPYMMNQSTDSAVQRGFDQSAVMNGIQGINTGIAGINTALCNGFAGVNQGFSAAEVANNARQMANMQQMFDLSTQFANCCCENRLATANLNATILAENCADRAAVNDALRDVVANQNAGFQSIRDQLCQDKIDAKNEKIADLQRQLSEARFDASQVAQTAMIEQYVRPIPNPAYVVQNPNCCGNYFNGCGCNG